MGLGSARFVAALIILCNIAGCAGAGAEQDPDAQHPDAANAPDASATVADSGGTSVSDAAQSSPDSAPPGCGPLSGSYVTTITVQSDGNTLGASVGWDVGGADVNLLNTPNTGGLTFQPVAVGNFGATITVPPGAPAGTAVINIAPGGGYDGYFKVTFEVPEEFTAIALVGMGTVDDFGRAFLNGNPISPPIGASGAINGSAVPFCTNDASFFRVGTNEFLLSDANTQAGPSGGAFFFTVTFYRLVN